MRWELIGGGRHSQIGEPHRIAARLDGLFSLEAGALDIDPAAGRAFAAELGVPAGRAYGDWREMLAREAALPPDRRLDLVTVATPNATHFEITKAFLLSGFNVLCEKPLAVTVEEADELCEVARRAGVVCAVNFGYSGYPMAVQAREMIRHGDLGEVRVVVAEFSHGAHADADDAHNPRVRWRYDPAQSGVSSVVADCGIHALHMAQFVTGQRITAIAAQFDRCVAGRELEDDALLAVRFDSKAVGRVWTSAVACGQPHGFSVRVFGSKGGLRWHQETPNQLHWSPLGGATQVLERAGPGLYPRALDASRITLGHPEGLLVAFANIYRALHRRIGGTLEPERHADFPTVRDGASMVRAVHAAAKSARSGGGWQAL